jgi:hypothetical protein
MPTMTRGTAATSAAATPARRAASCFLSCPTLTLTAATSALRNESRVQTPPTSMIPTPM